MLRFLFAICTTCVLWSMTAVPSLAASPFAGAPPTHLGVQQGYLLSCPSSPNCVVSLSGEDDEHYIAPLTYTGDRQVAYQALIKVLSVVPRSTIVTQSDDYLRAESRSRLMGFVDDVEFYLPTTEARIYMRSASRLGESDLGVNRRRLEQVRLAMADLLTD